MTGPLFPEPVRNAMRKGTSSQWAADLTADNLHAVLWMVGEFGRRASHVLAALEQQWSATPPRDRVAAARAKLALEGMFRAVCGDRPSEGEYMARWAPIAERVWAAALGRPPEMAPDEMGDLWPVVWEGQPVGSLKDPRHQLHGCVGSWAPASPASERFTNALGCLPQTPVVVSVGGVQSLIQQPPTLSGELAVFWCG